MDIILSESQLNYIKTHLNEYTEEDLIKKGHHVYSFLKTGTYTVITSENVKVPYRYTLPDINDVYAVEFFLSPQKKTCVVEIEYPQEDIHLEILDDSDLIEYYGEDDFWWPEGMDWEVFEHIVDKFKKYRIIFSMGEYNEYTPEDMEKDLFPVSRFTPPEPGQ